MVSIDRWSASAGSAWSCLPCGECEGGNAGTPPSCTVCAANYWSAQGTSTTCTSCADGYEITDDGLTAALHDADTDCSICPVGRYKDSRGIVKTPNRNKDGYRTIQIQKKTYKNHRVVAISFELPRKEGQTQVNHINRVPGDDWLENLEWATPAENTRHSRATNPDRKSNASKRSKPVKARKAGSNDEWVSYPSASAAARELELNVGSVSVVLNKKRKRAGDYEFEYDYPTEPPCLEGEVWKPFLTAQVSDMGRFKSCRGVVSTPTPKAGGYVYIGVDGKLYFIHRAIGVAFGLLTGMDDEREINHKDRNPSNNRLTNLEAVTRSQNIRHSYDTNETRASGAGKRSKPVRGRKCGEKEWTTYASASEAAHALTLNVGSVSKVVNKRCKRAGKYEFEYAEASEPACLEGERWVDIDVEKMRATPE